MPTPVGGGTVQGRAKRVAIIVADLNTFYNKKVGAAYKAYADAHPNMGADEAFNTWAGTGIAKGLTKGFSVPISAALRVIEGATVGAAQTTAGVAQSVDPASFLGILTEKSTWIRVAEFAIGAILLAVGVSKLAEGTPVGNAAKSALTKAALL
jgi:hypothetical protein